MLYLGKGIFITNLSQSLTYLEVPLPPLGHVLILN